jgi:hypothetical protein
MDGHDPLIITPLSTLFFPPGAPIKAPHSPASSPARQMSSMSCVAICDLENQVACLLIMLLIVKKRLSA